MNTVELSGVRRFSATWERDASLRLRAREPAAIVEYDRHGRITGCDRLGVHHGRTRRRGAAARRPDRRSSRRPPHHNHLRPRRQNFDRHAAYVVVRFAAGGRGRAASGGTLGIGQPSNRLRVMRRASHSSTETVRLSITGSISGTRSGAVAQVASGGESNKASSAGSGAWNTQSHRSKSARWIG